MILCVRSWGVRCGLMMEASLVTIGAKICSNCSSATTNWGILMSNRPVMHPPTAAGVGGGGRRRSTVREIGQTDQGGVESVKSPHP